MWIEDEIKSLRTEAQRLGEDEKALSEAAEKYLWRQHEMRARAEECALLAAKKRRDADRLERGERWGKYVTFQSLDEFMARPPVQPKDLNRGLDPLEGLPVPFLLAAFCAFWAGAIVWMVAG